MKNSDKFIVNKFLLFRERFNEVDQGVDQVDNSTMTIDSDSGNGILDTGSSISECKLYPNIYNWFNRNERRVLKKYGYDLSYYINMSGSMKYDNSDYYSYLGSFIKSGEDDSSDHAQHTLYMD